MDSKSVLLEKISFLLDDLDDLRFVFSVLQQRLEDIFNSLQKECD